MAEVNPKIRAMVHRYIQWSKEKPWLLLLFYLGLTMVSLWLAKTSLEVETSFEPLLPQGSVSVQALNESRERSGSSDLYTIAVRSPDAEANIRMVKALAEKMEKWPETRWVQVDRDSSFFADHALLYLPQDDLIKLRDQLKGEVKLEKKRTNPFFVDLRSAEEKKKENAERWKLERWLAPDLPDRLGLDRDLYEQIMDADKLGLPEEEAPKTAEATAAKQKEDAAKKPALPAHLDHYLISEDGGIAVVLVNLSEPPTDVIKAQNLLDRGDALIKELKPETFHSEMNVQVVGAYRTFEEAKSISNDSFTATMTSLGFVLLVLLVFFRSLRSVLLLVVPLLMGVSWSIGMTAITFGHLNVTTLFVFSMLVGMGIDFGIHYYARILEEFHSGRDMQEAIVEATVTTGRSMVSAALTTIVALLTLLVASFQGFVEFGVIAGYGIALCLLSAMLVMPSCIFALEKIKATKRREGFHQGEVPLTPVPQRKLIRTLALVLMMVGLTGSVLAAINWDKASFEHDFRNLRTTKSSAKISYGRAIGRGKSTTPSMILGKSPEQMRRVHASLSKLTAQNRASQEKKSEATKTNDAKLLAEAQAERTYIKNFITIETFVPPNQAERMKIISEINELVSDKKLKRSKGKANVFIDRMKDLSSIKPFKIEDVPGWASRSIKELDGTIGAIGYLYSDVQKWDMVQVQDFQDKLGVIKLEGEKGVPIASSQFILSDVIRTVKSDAATLTPIVFVVLLLILLVDLRSVKGALVCLVTMAVALLWTIGGMIIFDIKLGLYNMVLLPMVLGTGIDGSIHLYHRYKELGPTRVKHVFTTTGASVAASSLTTLAGFAGLIFVEHKGIQSIGYLAITGIAATLLAIFSFMPGLLTLVYGREDKVDAVSEDI